MPYMRLDKLLVHMGYGSRREIAALVKKGLVKINGTACRAPDEKVEPARDQVTVAEEAVRYQAHCYLMLNKPAGVITATRDGRHRTVLDLLSPRLQRRGLFPVGRLDKDTEGLLLLTTDGAFDHALMSPGRHVKKVYEARLEGTLAPGAEAAFLQGLTLGDGTRCLPATLERLPSGMARVTLREGKYHQVKRMLAACGARVTALRRVQVGGLRLDETLASGAFRELTAQELACLLDREP